jgi:membrane protease YdiL (CAAX protease family)
LPLGKPIASTIGVVFALACPFLNWEPILSHVPLPGIMLQFVTASALGAIAFGINKRPVEFFQIRGIGWSDIGAALLAFVAVLALLALAKPVVNHFGDFGTASPADDYVDSPLWFGLLTAVTAGVFEEFIYRGFVIEELGELIRSRQVAAVVSVVFFAAAHYLSYGWTPELIYPGLAGAVITVLYFSRRNLLICMLLHATIDSLGVLVARQQAYHASRLPGW